jgi:hypothetical protein
MRSIEASRQTTHTASDSMITTININDPRLSRSEMHLLRQIAIRLAGGVTIPKPPAAWQPREIKPPQDYMQTAEQHFTPPCSEDSDLSELAPRTWRKSAKMTRSWKTFPRDWP